MFNIKEKLEKFDLRLRRIERYCEALDQEQDQIYRVITDALFKEMEFSSKIGSDFNKAREERRKSFEFFKNKN